MQNYDHEKILIQLTVQPLMYQYLIAFTFVVSILINASLNQNNIKTTTTKKQVNKYNKKANYTFSVLRPFCSVYTFDNFVTRTA